MFIESLELKNYRNYDSLSIDFAPDINILYGDNAQGKTNILEAIYISATTKSHRGSKDNEIVNFNADDSHIKSMINKNDITHKIDMHLKKHGKKGAAIDGLIIKKSAELVGLCNIIFFSPEDLEIIKNGPAERRRFIDSELCQLDKVYLQYLSKYNKVIMQRNNQLKQLIYNPYGIGMLDVWDEQLVEYGSYIIDKRIEFIDELNEIAAVKHEKLTGGIEKLSLTYDMNVDKASFLDSLRAKRDEDIRRCITSVGPHRDDVIFYIDDMDVRKFGSQGQQRSVALSLKLSEIEIVKNTIKDNPILLLDDVLSELDSNRQNYLLNNINDVQVIITCTGVEEFIKNRLPVNKVYEVVKGTVTLKEA